VSTCVQSKPRCIGLALSGGAVRGAAHVGVLQVLQREGIEPAVVAGTSVGSLVGAAYAAGLPAEELGQVFRTVRWPKLARLSWKNRFSLFDTRPMEDVIHSVLGVGEFDQLKKPFAAVACDVVSGEKVVLRSGALAPALRASSAVPGVFPPVEMEGRLLVDGCVADNLPVDVARELGADFVIAVDIVPPPQGARRPRNILELMMITGYLWSRANHPPAGAIECLIQPEVGAYLGWDFNEVELLEACGRTAAEKALPGLVAALSGEPRFVDPEPQP